MDRGRLDAQRGRHRPVVNEGTVVRHPSGLVLPGHEPVVNPQQEALHAAAEIAERQKQLELMRRCTGAVLRSLLRAKPDLALYGLHPTDPDGIAAYDADRKAFKVEVLSRVRPEGDTEAPDPERERLEALASEAHNAWSGWMSYLFSKCVINADGTATVPQWAVERWRRQMTTPYADLPDEERESDRDEARRYLRVLDATEPPKG